MRLQWRLHLRFCCELSASQALWLCLTNHRRKWKRGEGREGAKDRGEIPRFQLGWAVYTAQRLRPQHGSIGHPQQIPSKYWVLKIRGRNSKKRKYPRSRILVADRIMSLRSSDYSSLKRRGNARFNIESMGSIDPHRQLPNESSPSQPAG